MSRPLRIEYNGAWYHVMNRGLERRSIFLNDFDRTCFFSLLKEISQLFSIEVHGFSLMDNHYHLLLHTPLAGLGRAMRHLNGVYTQKFNYHHRRDGPLLRGRYKAKVIDENAYLTEVLRYIHRNAVDAGICSRASEHQWTSHQYYLRKNDHFDWLKTDRLLELFDQKKNKARKRLDEFVHQEIPDDILLELKKVSLNIIGSDSFKAWMQDNFIEPVHRKTTSIPQKQKKLPEKLSPSAVIKTLAFMENVRPFKLRKKTYNNPARLEAAYFLRVLLGMPLKQVAKFTNMNDANTVSQALYRVRRRMENDKQYKKQIQLKSHYLQQTKKR